MDVRSLGNSGLFVSEITLGAMTWGRDTDIHEARDLLKIYYQAGGRLVDTADIYVDGVSEEVVGELSRDYPELLISTKAGVVRSIRRTNLSRKHLLESLDNSLRRLRRDHIDIWHLHSWDDQTPLEETMSALDYAVNSGKVGYVGVSNFDAWQIAILRSELSKNIRLISNQSEYSLLNRSAESQSMIAGKYLGVGFMAWSPLGRGVLTGKYRNNTPADSRAASVHMANYVAPYLKDKPKLIVEALATAAQGLGVSSLHVALRWVLQNQLVATTVIGPRTATQLHFILDGLDFDFPKAVHDALSEIST